MLDSEKAQLALAFAGLGVYILAISNSSLYECDFRMTEIMSGSQAFFLLWLGVISIIVSVVLTIVYLAKKNKNKTYQLVSIVFGVIADVIILFTLFRCMFIKSKFLEDLYLTDYKGTLSDTISKKGNGLLRILRHKALSEKFIDRRIHQQRF